MGLTIILILIFLIILVGLGYLLLESGLLKNLFGQQIQLIGVYEASATEPPAFKGSKIDGLLDNFTVLDFDPHHPMDSRAEVRVLTSDMPELVHARDIAFHPWELFSGRPTTLVHRPALQNEMIDISSRQAQIALSSKKVMALQNKSLMEQNEELAKRDTQRVIKTAKEVGTVKKVSGGGSPFMPYGGFRRPYSSYPYSSYGGSGGQGNEESEGGEE